MEKNNIRKVITARDVAQACGVSQATVSYAINDSSGGRISENTRQRVIETARQMGYFPSQSARSMRMNRAMAIGIVLGGNSMSMGVSHALRGVKRQMDAAGYAIMLLNDDDDVLHNVDYLSQYRAGRIDALLFMFKELTDELISELQSKQIPYLALSEQGIYGGKLALSSGYTKALADCANLMREKNYRRVRYYSFKRGEVLHSRKYNLFMNAMASDFQDADIKRVVLQVNDRTDEQLLDELYEDIRLNEFDIAITPHARLGWMVQNAIMRNQLSIPQSIKHICLSTAHPFALVYPSITMIDIPLTLLGETAATCMLNMITPSNDSVFDGINVPQCSLKSGMSTL